MEYINKHLQQLQMIVAIHDEQEQISRISKDLDSICRELSSFTDSIKRAVAGEAELPEQVVNRIAVLNKAYKEKIADFRKIKSLGYTPGTRA